MDRLFVQRDLEKIFEFRGKKLLERFERNVCYWLRGYLFCSRRFAGGVRFEPAASKQKFEGA